MYFCMTLHKYSGRVIHIICKCNYFQWICIMYSILYKFFCTFVYNILMYMRAFTYVYTYINISFAHDACTHVHRKYKYIYMYIMFKYVCSMCINMYACVSICVHWVEIYVYMCITAIVTIESMGLFYVLFIYLLIVIIIIIIYIKKAT